jgi:hypothetical protein
MERTISMDSEKLLLQILTELQEFKQETNARLEQIEKKLN